MERRPEYRNNPKSPELIHTPQDFYRDLANRISGAKRRVDLEFFTFTHDPTTQHIFDAIGNALTNEAMTVRIFYDHLGVSPFAMVKTALQLRKIAKNAKGTFVVQSAKNILHKGGVANLLDTLHKKVAVIDAGTDNGIAYMGGINISGKHADFGDLMVKLSQPDAVGFIADDFQATWTHSNGKPHTQKVDNETSLHSLGKGKEGNKPFIDMLIGYIDRALPGQRIMLETGYVDKSRIRQALIAAKNRGVDVEIVSAHPDATKSDFRYMLYPRRTAHPIVQSEIPFFLYHGKDSSRPSYDHTKIFVIGDRAFFGSFNFSTDWLVGNNEELVYETTNPELVSQLVARFEEDKDQSLPYQQVKQQQPPRRQKRW